MLDHKIILYIFNLIQWGKYWNNLKISVERTASLGLSCILQTELTWAPCECGKDIGELSYLDEILTWIKDLFILCRPFVVLFVVYSIRGSAKNKYVT